MKLIVLVIVLLVGLVSFGHGLALIYRPLGWLFAGAVLIIFTALAADSLRPQLFRRSR